MVDGRPGERRAGHKQPNAGPNELRVRTTHCLHELTLTNRRQRNAPDRCIVVDSLSKKVAPGLALGFIVPPERLRESVIASVRSGGWTATG